MSLFGFGKSDRCKSGTHRNGDKCIKTNFKSQRESTISKSQSESRPLKPLFPYFGGKQRVAKKIVKRFPRHDVLVEPFVGGGSVYWADTEAKRYVINDKNREVVRVYKTAKNSPTIMKSCDSNNMNKRKFKKIRNKSNKSACDVIKQYKHSFGGAGSYYAEKGKKFNNLYTDEHKDKLNKTTILNQDYKTVAKRYDKKSVVQYWDPPYVEHGNRYEINGVTSKDVCDTAKSLKNAKLVLSYDNNKEVRKHCKGGKLKIHNLYVPYSAQGGDNKGKVELLITNY